MLPFLFPSQVSRSLGFYAPLTSSTAPTKGSGSATFTRNLAAFYYNSTTDLLVQAAIDTARFEDGEYLCEKASTNLVLDSSDFNIAGANWAESAAGGSSFSGNSDAAPDGTVTADTLGDIDPTKNIFFIQNINLTDTKTYVFSVFVKMQSSPSVYPLIAIRDAALKQTALILDVSPTPSGVYYKNLAGQTAPTWVDWTEVNGYRRYSFDFTATATGAGDFKLYAAINTDFSDAANVAAVGTHVFWGASFAEADFTTSYVPNGAASNTRPADVLTYPVSGNLAVNDCCGTFDFTPLASASLLGTIFLFGSRVDVNNIFDVRITGTTLYLRRKVAGTEKSATVALNYVAGTKYKIGWRHSSTDGLDIWLDGTKGTGDSTTTDAVLDTNFGIGTDDGGNSPSSGHMSNFKIYSTPFSDGIMSALTT